ncbi:MAG TPA: electron transfer flavoprotein subunit alpha/FixB family protein [Gaiellaceae bacterium]|nr:electron transfer flavoprotein subunit alpha/FixB family protein [Gaiellaceae bacterium]
MILVLVEGEAAPAEVSLEAVTLARRLAGGLGLPLEAVAYDAGAAEGLGAHGVSRVHVVRDERLGDYAPEAWAEGVVEVVRRRGASIVVASGSDRGQELLAHAAAQLDAPFAANCVEVRAGDPLELVRQRWGGSLLEEARLSGPVKLLTLVPRVLAAEPAAEGVDLVVEELRPELRDEHLRVRVARHEEPEPGKVLLTDAKVVVGGGRGVGSAEGFGSLEELANLLGGAVGGSRVVTNLGWRSHADQIGQTGARIAPRLYIACGISGAIQHMVGCRGAKRILAINTDRHAPMVARADYAVIGDVQEIVPALVAELRR